MKKLKIYFILLLLFGFSSSFAQAVKSTSPGDESGTIMPDDRSNITEQEALGHLAGENNPSKDMEPEIIDPRMNPEDIPTEEDYGPSNAKPEEIVIDEERIEASPYNDKQPATANPGKEPISGNSQPAGEEIGTIINYRDIQGSGEQPAGDTPVNIENYRDMQGSGEQPPGDAPDK